MNLTPQELAALPQFDMCVAPADDARIVPASSDLDLIKAIDGLFACLAAWTDWTSVSAKVKREIEEAEAAGDRQALGEAVLAKYAGFNTRRRQRFQDQILAWCDTFGPLGAPCDLEEAEAEDRAEGYFVPSRPDHSEMVRDMMIEVWHLQLLSQRIAGHVIAPDDDNSEWAAMRVTEAANLYRRNPSTLEWEAPSLWSLICSAVLHSDESGWEFRTCAAPDCDKVFICTRANRVMCSPRCNKRVSAQKRARKKASP